MKKKYVIAFDQGTTSTRTIIFDLQGNIQGISQKELIQHYPESGWVEHNPNQIFIPFYTTKKNGSGIGLSLSKNIMKKHGGNLLVSSEVGVYTSFLLVFKQ